MENYKEEIVSTRKGCLGSSDARMLAQIATLGYVPKSAYKRLAVCKGLIEQEEIPRTAAIIAGDEMEMALYTYLSSKMDNVESNPLWVSKVLSRPNVKLITHPDIVRKEEETKTLFVYEVKTSRYSFEQTRQTYAPQLFIHNTIGKEIVKTLGHGWRLKTFLVHYNTDGLDLTNFNAADLDTERLTIKEVRFTNSSRFEIEKAINIVNTFLETFNEYYVGDEIDANMLPTNIRNEFMSIADALTEIQEREQKVDAFKKKLYDFMCAKDIKSIKNEFFSLTRVDESESKSFDAKRYMADYERTHPRVARRIMEKYTKKTKRSGYVKITVNERTNENK